MPELLAAAELHERIRAVLLFPEMVEINDHTDIPTPAGIRCALCIREGGNKAVFLVVDRLDRQRNPAFRCLRPEPVKELQILREAVPLPVEALRNGGAVRPAHRDEAGPHLLSHQEGAVDIVFQTHRISVRPDQRHSFGDRVVKHLGRQAGFIEQFAVGGGFPGVQQEQSRKRYLRIIVA